MQKQRTKSAPASETDPSDNSEKQPRSTEKKELKGLEKKSDSLLTHGLRIVSALLPSVFLAGVLSGILEASSGLSLEFGSLEFFIVSVPQVIVFYFLFTKYFAYKGLFVHPDNPDFKE